MLYLLHYIVQLHVSFNKEPQEGELITPQMETIIYIYIHSVCVCVCVCE
jgi:hypothetical protein